MEVIHDTPENPDVEPFVCSQCGSILVDPADQEEGMHFMCDPDIEPPEWDEGGESGD